ncbi:general stress protein [Mesobacillus campisalis]|uniref:general stress protein n=1 Tax=Mesobacillus campisalis TaxID=1408103 RepID=UPI000A07CFD1|nr:general stress protein [Mesobacillus campisalis]
MLNEHEKHLVGIYDDEREAIDAVEDLKRQGYRAEDISVIGKNKEEVAEINDETGTKAGEGAAAGAATGGILGGLTGLLAGIGALAIPGIGPIVAAGPIAATLTGAAAGAGIGGLAGALIGMGIPEEDAERYEGYVKEGKILVVVERRDNTINDPLNTSTDRNLTGGTLTGADPTDAPLTSDNPANTRLGHNREF